MQIYQVGGSLRDELLGIKSHDRDWVVVGAKPKDLEVLGYRRKGRYFPVFLHPQTQEEYALARTERKSGVGHQGFEVYSDVSVTLEEDLMRRDLTINAMARGNDGQWVDPFGGRDDLRQRKLRHVSEAFAEDPLRVLRVARFAAQLANFGFALEEETLALMRRVVASEELLSLSSERIFSEWRRALETRAPERFLRTLCDCGAWTQLYPEFASFEKDLNGAVSLSTLRGLPLGGGVTVEKRFAGVLWDLQRAYAMREDSWQRFCLSLRPPKRWMELADLACTLLSRCPDGADGDHRALLDWLDVADAWRRAVRFDAFLTIYQAALEQDAVSHPGNNAIVIQADALRYMVRKLKGLSIRDLRAQGIEKKALGTELRARRLAWLRAHVPGILRDE